MKVDYTDISKTYDNHRSYPESLINKIIELGEIDEETKVLDLGCGTGNVAFQLLRLINAKIIGIDISIPMLEIAKEKSLEVICADVDSKKLPFHDDSFGIIIGTYVIQHINNLASLFSECYRILQKGILLLVTANHKQIEGQHSIIKQFFPSFVDIDKGRFPDISKIDHLLNSAGFRDIKHHEIVVANMPLDQEYLQKVKNKYISTYHLLPQREFELGVERLEAFIKNRSQPEFREWRSTLICGRKTG